MSSLFEPGPWDNKEKTESVHVFSKKRKLVYGQDADHAEDGDEDYGKKELNKLHPIWRRTALKHMQGLAARTPAGEEVRMVRKVPRWRDLGKEGTSHAITGWPSDLGKDYALVEEMVRLGVFVIRQEDEEMLGIINRAKLLQAIDTYCTDDKRSGPPAASAAVAAAAGGPAPAFEEAASFEGARPGAVFKLGELGLGYYRDGDAPEPELAPLPDGWTEGQSPEGYTYYWHGPTSTSSWERPTEATALTQVVPLPPHAAAALRAAGPATIAKVQEQSGAVVSFKAGQAVVCGPARAIERAATLLQRKAEGLAYAASAYARATPQTAAVQPAAAPAGTPNWDFRAVVQQHDAVVAAGGGGGLAALAAYGDDDE